MDYTALRNEHQNVLEMRKKFIEKCFAEIPSTNSKNLSSHFIPFTSSNLLKNCIASIIIVLLCYVTCIALRSDSIPVTSNNNLTITVDVAFNGTVDNQTDSYNTSEGLDHSEDDNLLASESIFNDTQTHASTLFELSQTTNEILKEILLEMKKLNQRFQNLEKTQEKFDRRLENIEHLLATSKYNY
jgi:hypothetical protein